MIRPVKSDSMRTHRRHSDEFKRSLVEQSFLPGASVARIARDNGINANQLFGWRKLFKEARVNTSVTVSNTGMLAVEIAPSPANATSVTPPVQPEPRQVGVLCLKFAKVRMTIKGTPDPELLRTVLGMLTR
ncbi:transposase [Herbaspirillum sp. GCM10030257]|uniref:IS66-like element accessory protein TnpA n=1 Tax=Herbaspirillum sp. GCM10030257 TaxID=3273393 RepID=UPI003614E8BA